MDSHPTESVDPDEPILDLAVLAPGTLVASRYEIERLLGTGGFARVYAARDVELGQRIAIKILRSDRITPATLARLRREVSIARELSRPTLVRVYDLGQDGEHTFLTMELVEGETLRDRIRREVLSFEEIARLSEPILDALGTLHSAGVVHRDLKPANILIAPDGSVKLGDFGLARHWDGGEKVTRTEALVGTLEYVSPEQALGKQLDGRADLYAFGVLLFEMLTGRLPHEGATNIGLVMAHITSAAPDVRTVRRETPAWLAELIQRLMEKEPGARPQSAAEVVEVIRARKRDLGWRWRRSRARVAVYAAAVAAVTAGASWIWSAYWGAFDHAKSDALRRLIAVDRRGRVLWTKEALVLGNTAAVVKFDGTTPSIVGIPGACDGLMPIAENHRLKVFDPKTGEVTMEFDVPSAANNFPLDAVFGPSAMTAVDPDHDGREDIVLSYVHSPYWPSYSIYVDPRRTEATPIFVASGHHRLAGLADIDGDGVDELFFAGSNNKMGWFAGIAAVKLVRYDNTLDSSSPWIATGTPDAEYARGSAKAFLWYSLLPRMSQYGCRLLSSDPAKRLLRFEFGGETLVELTYDGFLPGSSTLPSEERRRGREDAYGMLREGLRTSLLGEHAAALKLIHEAHAKADAIADPSLAEWAATSEAIVMSRAGRAAEAEARFEELTKTSEAPLEICWQAGQAFEASGELERAARFLRRGVLEGTRAVRSGRTASAFFEPLMLVLAQQEKWDDAARDVARFKESIPEEYPHIQLLEIFVAWRRGGKIDTTGLVAVPGRQEVFNYWLYEARWANGVADPAAFLRGINEFRKLKPAPAYLYESLESEILARMGRTAEAKALAAKALADTTVAAKSEMVARAHVKVVQARSAAMSRIP